MQEFPLRWIATELAVGYAPRSYDEQWDLLDRYAEKLGASKAGIPEFQEKFEPPSDSFFEKWKTMLEWF